MNNHSNNNSLLEIDTIKKNISWLLFINIVFLCIYNELEKGIMLTNIEIYNLNIEIIKLHDLNLKASEIRGNDLKMRLKIPSSFSINSQNYVNTVIVNGFQAAL